MTVSAEVAAILTNNLWTGREEAQFVQHQNNEFCVADEILSCVVHVYRPSLTSTMAENLSKAPRRGILKQSTSFEQRGEDK